MKVYRPLFAFIVAAFFITGCEKLEYTDIEWNVGDWAEYEVTGGSLESYTLRYAITGSEQISGEDYYWLEMIGTSGASRFVYKMLVPYGYRGVAERMIIKVNDQPALEMPDEDGLAEEPPGENRPYMYLVEGVTAGKIGEEKITVPGGEYNTIHAKTADYRKREAELWLSTEVPVMGLVRQNIAGEEMKLKSTGNGAKTAITEEPQQIDAGIFE